MRHLLTSVAVLLAAAPAWAERFEIAAPVTEATIFPLGAMVTRQATLTLPAGQHDIVIPGLPQDTDPASLRIEATGAGIGAVSLQRGRATPDTTPDSPAIRAQKAEVMRLERALADRDAATAAIRAEAEAARDMIAFLKSLPASDAAGANPAGMVDDVAARLLSAHRTIVDAENRASAADQGRDDQVRALDQARARLDALQSPDADSASVVLTATGNGAPATLRVTTATDHARWEPAYDLRLNRGDGTLALDRGLVVAQDTGEDWANVNLTLSTARASGQSQPTELFPHIVRTYDAGRDRMMERAAAAPQSESYAAPVVDAEPVVVDPAPTTALSELQGATVVYRYPAPVTVRTGDDSLHLALDSRPLKPELVAEAVPSRDSTAYLMADLVNDLGEIILPGRATLHVDGAMTGTMDMPLTAPGDDLRLGFGAIDGIVLERRVPGREQGQGGFISRSNSREETEILIARNLTDRDWPLRVIHQVPVSEQKELSVSWSANPKPSETDPDGKRGLLVWDSTLGAGDTQEITVNTTVNWPEGQVLEE